jgi:hypothetical protein
MLALVSVSIHSSHPWVLTCKPTLRTVCLRTQRTTSRDECLLGQYSQLESLPGHLHNFDSDFLATEISTSIDALDTLDLVPSV